MDIFDAIIIGAGPAGLSAGIYLARFRRKTLIIDAEEGRSMVPGPYHNIAGFFNPVERKILRQLGADQAEMYGAEIVNELVTDIEILEPEMFKVTANNNIFYARNIIICAGEKDNLPDVPDCEKYFGYSFQTCPVCSGYEDIDKKVVGIGNGDKIAKFAMLMQLYTDNIKLITNGEVSTISEYYADKLRKKNISVYTDKIVKFIGENRQILAIMFEDGTEIDADVVYTELGVKVNSDLAQKLGISVDERGCINVDEHQKTNIEGIYAAGDVTNFDNNQVVSALYEGYMAAYSINSKLLKEQIEKI